MKETILRYLFPLIIRVLDSELVDGLVDMLVEFIREKFFGMEKEEFEERLTAYRWASKKVYFDVAYLEQVLHEIIGYLKPADLVDLADRLLDYLENYVMKTETKVDDYIVMPFCQLIRGTFGIVDND